MKTNLKKIFLFIVFCSSVSLFAQDWPQYMGPNRNSITEQEGLLQTWPDGGPEVLWSTNVGIGYGGPVVKDGKIYLLDRNDEVGDKMRCFDLTSGEELWSFEYSSPGSVMFPGSRSVPIVDDKYVYSCGPYGDLYCIDINTKQPVWNVNVWTDFGGKPAKQQAGPPTQEEGSFPTWAISQCPLIYGDLLIIASQAPQAGVVAYNKLTGDVKWKTPSLGSAGYVSPTIVKIDGKDQVVMIGASSGGFGQDPVPGKVIGVAPNSGETIWEFNNWLCHIPVPSAVDAGKNKILITGGYELGALMLEVKKDNSGAYTATELFRTEEFGDQTKTPIFYKDHFYAQYGTNNKRDGLSCMDMNGNIKWKTKRDPDFNKGSMVMANGLILATDGSKTLYLIEPNPTEFKAIASAELLAEPATSDDGGISSRVGGKIQNWAPIALADGKLLIRDQQRLMCVKVAE